jgi:hypothetical protein
MKQKLKKGPEKKARKAKVKRSVQQSIPSVQEQLGALARSTIASLKRDDERTWKLNKRDDNEPMSGEATWHPHH